MDTFETICGECGRPAHYVTLVAPEGEANYFVHKAEANWERYPYLRPANSDHMPYPIWSEEAAVDLAPESRGFEICEDDEFHDRDEDLEMEFGNFLLTNWLMGGNV